MDRRRFLLTSVAGAFAAPLAAGAQQVTKIPRIGYLAPYKAQDPTSIRYRDAFRQGLRELGYIENQNIVIEYRNAGDQADRLPVLAADLVSLKVDIIVTAGTQAARAAQQASRTIPIVMASASDPVRTGLVATLARPGANITGLSLLSPELAAKRLELLRELVPGVSRVAILWNPDDPPAALSLRETEAASRALTMEVQLLAVRSPDDFETAFRAAVAGHAAALIVLPAPILNSHAKDIATFALTRRLPTVSYTDSFPLAGGLVSYGPNLADLFHRAAVYVDKILKGTKPANLPVEQPTKFDLVINLKTAKALGLTIPPSLLARADQVIE